MNVIMPTAMVTMHNDTTLSASSARTAQRGLRLLKALKEYSPEVIVNNANAILAVAKGDAVKGRIDGEEMESEGDKSDKLIKVRVMS